MSVPTQSVVNIGLVGHVDHGKTSITRMLSDKWTDTHSEELKRGISIRLGYADALFKKGSEEGIRSYTTKDVDSLGKKTKVLRRVSFVDAPGHETLMATMLSGAALMQGAVLIIAANEKCPQPRTIEHLMAIKMSGVENLVVVQNKIDLVTKEKAKENYNNIKEFLKDYGYKNVPIVPVSANLGINKDALIATIEQTIKTPEPNDDKNLKMHVVRSFDINSPGTIVDKIKGGVLGGSIAQGKIKIGDEIEITPGFSEEDTIKTKVISLGTEFGPLKEARSGGLIAVGTTLDPSVAQNDKLKGKLISKPGSLSKPTSKVTLEVKSFDRMLVDTMKTPIVVNEPFILTIGTATNVGKVKSVRGEIVEFNLSQISTFEVGDRVALSRRTAQGWRLYGYGITK